MSSLSYKSLYTLVSEEIDRKSQFPGSADYKDQISRTQFPGMAEIGNRINETSASDLINGIMDLLESVNPPRIKSGLTIKETDPKSDEVTVTAGEGTVGGRIYTLVKDTNIAIPFDDSTEVFYLYLWINGLEVGKTPAKSGRLPIGKIVVPKPGTTNRIKNKRDDDYKWDAYIVNHKEVKLYGDPYDNLEEDSIDLLRDSIGDILTDNLIGNIRLNEDLKIINTAGTMELNSDSLKLLDTNENTLMKLNQNGTFFYDTDGVELAKFSVDGARVGNIEINTSNLQSQNFSSGALGSGFRIEDGGYAEFQNIFVRGKLTSSVFENNSVSAVGGNILVSHDADKLSSDMTASSTTLTTDGDVTFAVGDILWLKDGTNSEYMTVDSVTSSTTYTVTRANGGSAVAWKEGTAIVNLGQSGDGGIFMTASENYAPYLSVFTQDGSPWSGLDTKVRIGNLNGFLGYSTDKYGIAIGETDKYLKYDPTNGLRIKGDITITGGNASVTYYQSTEPGSSGDTNTPKDGDFWVDTDNDNITYVYNSGSWIQTSSSGITDDNGMIDTAATPIGAGLYLGSSYMGYYDSSQWKTYIDSSGNFLFKGDNSNYIQWDGMTLDVRGSLNADDISAGTINGLTIQGNTIEGNIIKTASSGARVRMDSDNFIAYDGESGYGNEIFRIWLTGTNSGDVQIGDYYSDNGMLWDSSTGKFNVRGTMNIGTAGKVYIDGANEVIKVYDDSGNLRVELGKLS